MSLAIWTLDRAWTRDFSTLKQHHKIGGKSALKVDTYGHCQVDEKHVDQPPRYCALARREPTMLGIKNGRCCAVRKLTRNGIVKLSGIAMIDPQHTWFATGLEPIILGVGQPDSA